MAVGVPHGVILAGGRSRRMGGGDKGLIKLAGQPMLAHVIDRLGPQVARLAISAGGDPARFAAFGLPVLADTVSGFVGPLAGLLAGMRWASREGAVSLVIVPGDVPFVPRDLVARLAAGAGTSSCAAASSGGRLHPVIGLWPVARAGALEDAIRGGLRKALVWAECHDTMPVEFAFLTIGAREVDPFFNVNTPEDLALAEAILRESASAGPS